MVVVRGRGVLTPRPAQLNLRASRSSSRSVSNGGGNMTTLSAGGGGTRAWTGGRLRRTEIALIPERVAECSWHCHELRRAVICMSDT